MNKFEPILKTADVLSISTKNLEYGSDSNLKLEEDFELMALSGLVYPLNSRPALYSFSNQSLPIFKEKLDDLKGEWVAILADKDRTTFKIISDYFGFQSVFYRLDEISKSRRQLTVSTSYNSLIEYSKNNALPCSINEEQFYLSMAARNIRLRTAFSSKTFCREINLLKVDEYLYFDSIKNVFKVQNRPFLFDPLGRSYEELIKSGVDKAKQDIKSISHFYKDKRLFLSGGRDSRIVLALLSSLGLNEEYSISSANPSNFSGYSKEVIQNDLYVSNYLAHEYKMKFSHMREHIRLELDFEESLKGVLSHWSQFSWIIKPMKRAMLPKNTYLTLRGGGGELIRASAASRKAIIDVKKNNPNFDILCIDDQVNELFDLFVNAESIPNEYLDKCRILFSEAFIFNKDFSLEQNIDWHYHYYRNRVHFGQYISSFGRNEITFHPLMQKELFYAANCHELTSRREGRVCYDIIESLDPLLNYITFDDGFWPNTTLYKSPSLKDLRSSDLREYYKVQAKNSHFLKSPIVINKVRETSLGSFSQYELYIKVINILFELLYERKYTIQNITNIIKNLNYGKVSSLELFMKLIDYKNHAQEYSTYYNLITINNFFEKKYFEKNNYEENLLSDYQSCFRNFSYDISENEGLILQVNFDSKFEDIFDNIEYAFYLYEDEKILERKWYSKNNLFRHTLLKKGKIYFIRIFIRFILEKEAMEPIIIDSDVIKK